MAFSALYIDMNGVLFPGDQVVKSCYQERMCECCNGYIGAEFHLFNKSKHDVMTLHDYK